MERWQKPEPENALGRSAGDYHSGSRSGLDYNTPLRSVRGDATSTPSPFYKLSAELSRESLRIPGAVPFIWEQRPGCRKFTAASPPPLLPVITPHSAILKPQAGSFVPESTSTLAVDPAKPSLATLFRQPSPKGRGVVVDKSAAADSWPDAPMSSAIPQILPPPASDHPRSSSARYSVMHRSTPPGTSFNNAALQIDNNDDDDTVSEEGISDAVTATAGEGLSVDDSLVPSGALRPASTPSEARDFIMHRFLPAAHTIACESPQTPSRRFLPSVGVAAMPSSPSTAGSFRDCTAACRPSPLRYASASSTPASNARQVPPRSQLHAGSFRGEAEQEEEEEEEEDEEEEPPFTPKSCGIFPFRITISFHNRRTTGQSSRRRNFPSKHQHNKQQQQKKGCKSINCASSPMRIIDILRDDHSSSHDSESPVHRLRSKHSEADRERIKIAVLEQAGLMHTPATDHRSNLPLDSYYRENCPNLRQLLTAQHAASVELYNVNEEASEYGSYQDAPSRFQSPSPAGFHLNARALKAHNVQAQRARSFAGLQDDHASAAAIISTTEQHLLNSSFYYYNMHSSTNKPHLYQPHELASPSTYHTPLFSHVGAPHQLNCAYHENLSNNIDNSSSIEKANYDHGILATNAEQWDALASPQLPQKTHIINNALFEHQDQEANMIAHSKWAKLNQAGQGGRHHGNGESNIINNADHIHLSAGAFHPSNSNHHMIDDDLSGGKGDVHHVNNGNHYHVSNGHHYVTNGNHPAQDYVSNNSHYYARKDDPHFVINADNHVINANNHLSYNGDHMYVSANGDVHANVNSSLPSKSPLTPLLPKSPTHSWLDRAMPLVASTSNKRLGASSRLSHMHKAISPADNYAAPVSTSQTRKQGSSTEASKWEALVKGSHLQPGHLRFSEELFHQSQSVMKVGAT